MQKEQPRRRRRPRTEVELRPSTARTLDNLCAGRHGQLARSIAAAAVTDNDLDAVGLPHRLEAGPDRTLLIEGRDDNR